MQDTDNAQTQGLQNHDRLNALIQALQDKHVSAGWNAAKELGSMGPDASSALPALNAALASKDSTLVLWSRYAIARITGDAMPFIHECAAALDDGSTVWPGMAATALSGFGAAAAPALPSLVRGLSSQNVDDRWAAAWAIGNIGTVAVEALPRLIAALDDPDEKVRWYVAWAIGELARDDASLVEPLKRALLDFDDDVRGYAARALGRNGVSDPEAIEQLRALLNDENPAIVEAAASALTVLTASADKAEAAPCN